MTLPYHRFVAAVAERDVKEVLPRDTHYQGSWQKRGGSGIFHNLSRKWDRIEAASEAHDHNIQKAIQADPSPTGLIDDIRDLRRYLLLTEAWLIEKGDLNREEEGEASPVFQMTTVRPCAGCELAFSIDRLQQDHDGFWCEACWQRLKGAATPSGPHNASWWLRSQARIGGGTRRTWLAQSLGAYLNAQHIENPHNSPSWQRALVYLHDQNVSGVVPPLPNAEVEQLLCEEFKRRGWDTRSGKARRLRTEPIGGPPLPERRQAWRKGKAGKAGRRVEDV